jgi:hypothetical protein
MAEVLVIAPARLLMAGTSSVDLEGLMVEADMREKTEGTTEG